MRQIVVIASFSGKAIAFLHNQGLECSRTLQRAAGILQRAQDDYYSITPMPFPCLNSPNRVRFCCPLGVSVARSAFQVKRAYVTMPHASVKLLWIYCMQTCLFFVEHNLHKYMFNKVLLFPESFQQVWCCSLLQKGVVELYPEINNKCSSKAPQIKIDDSNIKRSIEKGWKSEKGTLD